MCESGLKEACFYVYAVNKLQLPAQTHLAEQEVDSGSFHDEGTLLLVVCNSFTHIQRPLFPALYHATFPH